MFPSGPPRPKGMGFSGFAVQAKKPKEHVLQPAATTKLKLSGLVSRSKELFKPDEPKESEMYNPFEPTTEPLEEPTRPKADKGQKPKKKRKS